MANLEDFLTFEEDEVQMSESNRKETVGQRISQAINLLESASETPRRVFQLATSVSVMEAGPFSGKLGHGAGPGVRFCKSAHCPQQ